MDLNFMVEYPFFIFTIAIAVLHVILICETYKYVANCWKHRHLRDNLDGFTNWLDNVLRDALRIPPMWVVNAVTVIGHGFFICFWYLVLK